MVNQKKQQKKIQKMILIVRNMMIGNILVIKYFVNKKIN